MSTTKFDVWREVQRIRWGEVKTYREVAESLGCHWRTVGNAMKALNEPTREAIVPWWRVVYGGRPGNRLASYSGRTREQARLLVLEGHLVEMREGRYVISPQSTGH